MQHVSLVYSSLTLYEHNHSAHIQVQMRMVKPTLDCTRDASDNDHHQQVPSWWCTHTLQGVPSWEQVYWGYTYSIRFTSEQHLVVHVRG